MLASPVGRGIASVETHGRWCPVAVIAEQIVGREPELESLAAFLDTPLTGAGALLLAGEPGIGKTTLWRAAVEDARGRGYRVLACRPAESETKLSFAALGDLLEGAADEALPVLPEPQRRALEIALLRADAGGSPPRQRAVAVGFLGVLHALAASGPLLLAIDDAQWLDRSSARVLEFVLRRLGTSASRVLVSVRAAKLAELPLGLEGAFPNMRLQRVEVGPLSVGALGRLLRGRLDVSFPRPTLLQLHRTAGGNAFFALELARALAHREEQFPPGAPLPVPASLHALLGERLARLPAGVREVLALVAAVDRPTQELLAASSGATPRRVARLLDQATAAGVIEFDDGRILFTHPLIAAAISSQLEPLRRRQLHRRLAKVVTDSEERARHLAAAAVEPDREVAAVLEEAAERAHSRGAPDAAAELGERSAALTPPGLRAETHRRRLASAQFHFEAGNTARARTLLEGELAALPSGPERAEVLLRLRILVGLAESRHAANEFLREALAEAGDDDPIRASLHVQLAWNLMLIGYIPSGEQEARAALEVAERLADTALLAQTLAILAYLRFYLGRGIDTAAIERALELERSCPVLGLDQRPSTVFALLLMGVDQLDEARGRLERLRDDASERGDATVQSILSYLSRLECRAGNWQRAAAYAEDALELALESGRGLIEAQALNDKCWVETHQGKVESARRDGTRARELAERSGTIWIASFSHAYLGFLELSCDDLAAAEHHLRTAARLYEQRGFGDPGWYAFFPDWIEVLIARGDLEEARSTLDAFEAKGRALDRAWVLATAGRCRGLLAAATGDREASLAAFEGALAQHQRVARPFDLGRTLLAKGTVLRHDRQRRAARESLEEALAFFQQLGAPLWAEKARAELARIGGRAPASGQLTPTEQRVAALVADGSSNKEVAAALVVTVKTVEANLSRVYAKLGVRSRTELARRLSRADTEAAGKG